MKYKITDWQQWFSSFVFNWTYILETVSRSPSDLDLDRPAHPEGKRSGSPCHSCPRTPSTPLPGIGPGVWPRRGRGLWGFYPRQMCRWQFAERARSFPRRALPRPRSVEWAWRSGTWVARLRPWPWPWRGRTSRRGASQPGGPARRRKREVDSGIVQNLKKRRYFFILILSCYFLRKITLVWKPLLNTISQRYTTLIHRSNFIAFRTVPTRNCKYNWLLD